MIIRLLDLDDEYIFLCLLNSYSSDIMMIRLFDLDDECIFFMSTDRIVIHVINEGMIDIYIK